MRITSKGQVTIPIEIREKLGLLPDTEVEFDIVGRTARIRRARSGPSRGKRIVEQLRGTSRSRMTTDEILELTRGAAKLDDDGSRR